MSNADGPRTIAHNFVNSFGVDECNGATHSIWCLKLTAEIEALVAASAVAPASPGPDLPWHNIDSAPKSDSRERPGTPALLYGPQIGVRSGECGNHYGLIFANIAGLHGNAVEHWGVTHWMPLPASPGTAAPVPTADEVRKVLEPFATHPQFSYLGSVDWADITVVPVQFGHLRAARALLARWGK